MAQRKIKVGVLFGGRSGEHDVSLMSARSVMAALDQTKYEIVPIGITREGEWVVGALPEIGAQTPRAALLAGAQPSALMQIDAEAHIAPLTELDVIFPVLHGTFGEDGTVQGLLELANIPYVGAGVVGSAVGMDKAIFKHVMQSVGLPVLPWRLVLRSQWDADPAGVVAQVEATLPYPLFVKPANLGSSVGISKCEDRAALHAGLALAARFDRRLVVEQGIRARELEVSVLGNAQPVASIVGEIRPRRAFYDYEAKYISDDSELLIPAPLAPELAARVRTLAVQAYAAIDCAGLGRVDFLYDEARDRLYVNEINTIPGFTRISMYPKLWEASGVSYPALLDRLIELALARYADKCRSQTTFEIAASSESGNNAHE